LRDDAQDADKVDEHQGDHVGGEVRIVEFGILQRDVHGGGDEFENDDRREQHHGVRVRGEPRARVPAPEQQAGGHVEYVDGPR